MKQITLFSSSIAIYVTRKENDDIDDEIQGFMLLEKKRWQWWRDSRMAPIKMPNMVSPIGQNQHWQY